MWSARRIEARTERAAVVTIAVSPTILKQRLDFTVPEYLVKFRHDINQALDPRTPKSPLSKTEISPHSTLSLVPPAVSRKPARRWLDDIALRGRNLGETPGFGVARPDVRPDLRMFPVGNYLILYRPIEAGVEIVRVLHDARRWRALS
jgi:toxin ParE1/3/4